MNLKYVLIGAVTLAAIVLGGWWLFLRQQPAHSTLNAFQASCLETQRRNISGSSTLPLDDETEARLLAFCDCVAREVAGRLSSQDIAAIGLEQSSPAIDAKVGSILALCRTRNP